MLVHCSINLEYHLVKKTVYFTLFCENLMRVNLYNFHTVSTFLHKIFLRPNYVLLPNFVAEFGEDNCYEGKIVQEFQKYLPKFGVDSSAIYCEFFHLEYGQSCNKEKVRNITSVHDDRFSVNVWNSSQVSNEVVSVHKWRDAIQSYTLFRPVSFSENMNRIYKWLESCVLTSESVYYQKIHSNQFWCFNRFNVHFIMGNISLLKLFKILIPNKLDKGFSIETFSQDLKSIQF